MLQIIKNILRTNFNTILLLLAAIVYGCTEEIDLGDQLVFEDAIVVEATITDELKNQSILITRTYQFEDYGPSAESNARVQVVEDGSNTYEFTESSPGVYLSEQEFKAEIGKEYQLFITTDDDRSYTTSKTILSSPSVIDDVYVTREFNSLGTEIVSFNVDSYDPSRSSNYYRYEYEESYKIIAPLWVNEDLVILQDENGNDLALPGFAPRPTSERVCYNTSLSNSIIQTSTTNLMEDRVAKFPVRTISADDPIISHRYSILVKQYVQSLDAYSYYSVLHQLSGSDNLFSQIQPGFISSNIRSTVNRNEKVLGFFEVASVSEKRIFFDYVDLFPDEVLPPYFISCNQTAPLVVTQGGQTPLADAIRSNLVKFFLENIPPAPNEGPYWVIPRGCGDCTVFGTSVIPDFWSE